MIFAGSKCLLHSKHSVMLSLAFHRLYKELYLRNGDWADCFLGSWLDRGLAWNSRRPCPFSLQDRPDSRAKTRMMTAEGSSEPTKLLTTKAVSDQRSVEQGHVASEGRIGYSLDPVLKLWNISRVTLIVSTSHGIIDLFPFSF